MHEHIAEHSAVPEIRERARLSLAVSQQQRRHRVKSAASPVVSYLRGVLRDLLAEVAEVEAWLAALTGESPSSPPAPSPSSPSSGNGKSKGGSESPSADRTILNGEHDENPYNDQVMRREGDSKTKDDACNGAYDGLGYVWDYYWRLFERNSLDGNGLELDGVVHYGKCNPPEAPIWMGDLSFKALGDVQVGDTVIGWERKQGSRAKSQTRNYLTEATVLAVNRRQAPLVRIEMESGRVIRCTPDHYWREFVAPRTGTTRQKNQYSQPYVGMNMTHVVDPTPELTGLKEARAAAWLGGIYDGEAHGVAISQSYENNPEVCARIEESLNVLGLPYTTTTSGESHCGAYVLAGGASRRQHLVDFANWTDIARKHVLKPHVLGARWQHRDRIVSITPDGDGEVLSMMTTTGNYVAWGYASKNSYDNAFYDQQTNEMSFGDGDDKIFKIGGFTSVADMDVPAHELSHGVSAHAANLGYTNQVGGLNEAFSDIMGICCKYWVNGTATKNADWIIGSSILAEGINGVGLRSMKDPGSAYDDPVLGTDPQYASADDYSDGDDPHISSGVVNHAFYLFATSVGGNPWETPAKVFYDAMTSGNIPSDCDWATYAQATLDACSDSETRDALQGSWQQVKVLS
jgi:hypothetical protein